MKTSQEIRLENLSALIAEAGSAAALARLCEVPAPYISQLVNKVTNDSGEVRKMGDETARKMERGMKKPKGWIDADHAMPGADLEDEAISILRLLTPERRSAVLDSLRGVLRGQAEAETRPAGPAGYKKITPIPAKKNPPMKKRGT